MLKKLFGTFVLGLSFFHSANAAITTYTSESAWVAAVTEFYNEPFDSTGLLATTGVTTTTGSIGAARANLSGSVWTDSLSGTSTTTFSFIPSDLIGLGGTWDTAPGGEGTGLIITLNLVGGGTASTSTFGPLDGGFFGVTSDERFTSMTISAGTNSGVAETFDLDDLHFAVPEPATMAVLGFGLVSLGVIRRR